MYSFQAGTAGGAFISRYYGFYGGNYFRGVITAVVDGIIHAIFFLEKKHFHDNGGRFFCGVRNSEQSFVLRVGEIYQERLRSSGLPVARGVERNGFEDKMRGMRRPFDHAAGFCHGYQQVAVKIAVYNGPGAEDILQRGVPGKAETFQRGKVFPAGPVYRRFVKQAGQPVHDSGIIWNVQRRQHRFAYVLSGRAGHAKKAAGGFGGGCLFYAGRCGAHAIFAATAVPDHAAGLAGKLQDGFLDGHMGLFPGI